MGRGETRETEKAEGMEREGKGGGQNRKAQTGREGGDEM